MSEPSIYELEIFVAVAETKSFSSAANLKDITQPVVSRTIRKLEERFHASLFKRTTRKVHLTVEGEWLLERAYSILKEHETIMPHFQHLNHTVEGAITVDAATPFSLYAIVPLLRKLRTIYPELKVNLINSEGQTELLNTNVDIAIRIGDLQDSTMRARKLGVTHRGLYASPKYIAQNGLPTHYSHFTDHQLLGFHQFEHLNRWPLKTDENEMFIVNDASVTSNSGESLKQMALNHLGIACLSRFTVKQDIGAGRLVPIMESEWQNEGIPIYAVFYTGQHLNLRTKAFLDFLVENITL
ncbi:LysR family transcriptional regulator [Vibrio sp. T187]|uniref:LysR family transcriptional regulator n=1 Tax=Vibrio TaxID=662 RepID=UPI0010C969C7|nr:MULTISPECIES: LysR family transcriptional regulator [Vibrio]MBW3696165.1 LysR family transcriptional regulator [Vibrio sp. T187]